MKEGLLFKLTSIVAVLTLFLVAMIPAPAIATYKRVSIAKDISKGYLGGIAIFQLKPDPKSLPPFGAFFFRPLSGNTVPLWAALYWQGQVQNPRGSSSVLIYETQRFGATTATAASQGALATTSFTWPIPFSDAQYSAFCEVAGTVTANPVSGGTNQTANTAAVVKFTIATASASASSSTESDCVGIHD
jgi:hypothetical protein